MVQMELEKAKQILKEAKAKQYTDDEIQEMLKFLNVFKEVMINNLLKEKADEKCNSVR